MYDRFKDKTFDIKKNINLEKNSLNNKNNNFSQNFNSDNTNTLYKLSQNIKKKQETKKNNFRRKIEIEIPNNKTKITRKRVFTSKSEMMRNFQYEQVTDPFDEIKIKYKKDNKLNEKNICTQTAECKIIKNIFLISFSKIINFIISCNRRK